MESEPKRRKLYSSNTNSSTTTFGRGCKGVFVTSDRNKESQAVTETYRLLDQYIEYISEEKPETEDKNVITNDLDKELAELTRKGKPSHFSRIDLGMKGISFIRILKEDVDPVKAVKFIIGRIKDSGMPCARYAARIIPIQDTCYAHLDDVVSVISKAIPLVFTEATRGKSWFCQIKRRNNDTFDKDALIKAIAPLVDNEVNPVSLRGGDICVHVDINKGVCGVSIISDWASLNDLSLRTLLDEKKVKEDKVKKVKEADTRNVNALDQDWKCGSCGSPNFQKNDLCWKCGYDRRVVII